MVFNAFLQVLRREPHRRHRRRGLQRRLQRQRQQRHQQRRGRNGRDHQEQEAAGAGPGKPHHKSSELWLFYNWNNCFSALIVVDSVPVLL